MVQYIRATQDHQSDTYAIAYAVHHHMFWSICRILIAILSSCLIQVQLKKIWRKNYQDKTKVTVQCHLYQFSKIKGLLLCILNPRAYKNDFPKEHDTLFDHFLIFGDKNS